MHPYLGEVCPHGLVIQGIEGRVDSDIATTILIGTRVGESIVNRSWLVGSDLVHSVTIRFVLPSG